MPRKVRRALELILLIVMTIPILWVVIMIVRFLFCTIVSTEHWYIW